MLGCLDDAENEVACMLDAYWMHTRCILDAYSNIQYLVFPPVSLSLSFSFPLSLPTPATRESFLPFLLLVQAQPAITAFCMVCSFAPALSPFSRSIFVACLFSTGLISRAFSAFSTYCFCLQILFFSVISGRTFWSHLPWLWPWSSRSLLHSSTEAENGLAWF